MLIAITLSPKNALYRIHCVFYTIHMCDMCICMVGMNYYICDIYIWYVSMNYFSEFKLHVDLSKIKKDVLTSFSTP